MQGTYIGGRVAHAAKVSPLGRAHMRTCARLRRPNNDARVLRARAMGDGDARHQWVTDLATTMAVRAALACARARARIRH